jgi:hypothetical protein
MSSHDRHLSPVSLFSILYKVEIAGHSLTVAVILLLEVSMTWWRLGKVVGEGREY